MSPSELKKEFASAIAKGDVEKARDLSRAFGDPFLPSWRPVHDLLCQTLTNENPEICNEYVVSKILENGAPVDFLCSHGLSPLFHAVAADKTDIVKLLLKKGGDPNTVKKPLLPSANEFFLSGQLPVPNGFSLLHVAAHNGNEQIIKLLLECGVKPTIDEFCGSPLHYAATNGSLSIVNAILNSEFEISSINLPESRSELTPLHLAVRSNHEDIVSLLLEKGMYDDHVSKDGFTPFYSAAVVGNKKIIELFLAHDQVASDRKSTSVKNKEDWLEGYIAMYLAAFHGHVEVVQMFLDLGVDPNASFKDYLTPLHAASLEGHKDIVKLLLDSGVHVNPKGEKDSINNRIFPPLISAIFRRHEDIVELLLNSGADTHVKVQNIDEEKGEMKSKLEMLLTCVSIISASAKGGYTPLHWAVRTGSTSIVKLLLKHGADVNAKSDCNKTPLSLAVIFEHEKVVACLLEAGADIEASAEGCLPFFIAIQIRNLGIVELLFEYMDPLILASSSFLQYDLTPVQYAVAVESAEIVEFLSKNGASVNHYVEEDFPLHSAIDLRNQGIVLKLIEHGAHVSQSCSRGVTAIFHAITKNDIDMCKLLLKKGASLKEKVENGLSVLHYAIIERLDKKMIKFLVECGADLTEIVDGFLPIARLIYCTMADHAEEITKGNTEDIQDNDEIVAIFKLLLEHGSPLTKPEGSDLEVRSPFRAACTSGYVTGVKLLVNYDTDFDEGLIQLRKTFGKLIKRLTTQFGSNAHEVELQIFDFDSSDNKQILSYPRRFDFLYKDYDFAKFREECERFRKITQIMTQAIARMEGGGMKIKEEHLWLVNSAFARSFYQRCKEEIKEMKSTVFSGRATCFDLLRANEDQLTAYARNEDIIEAIKSTDFGKLFPLYSEDLRHQIKRGVNMNNLLEMSLKILNKTFETKIPILISYKIFNYLSSIDLRNLCRIYNPYMFLTADASNV